MKHLVLLSSLRPLHLLLAAALAIGGAIGAACGPQIADCRHNPHCGAGGLGAYCDNDNQCFDGYCCEKEQCDGGMCSLRCDNDGECPAGMLCEHNACFFTCDVDGHCAPGQECKHGNRVCEW